MKERWTLGIQTLCCFFVIFLIETECIICTGGEANYIFYHMHAHHSSNIHGYKHIAYGSITKWVKQSDDAT